MKNWCTENRNISNYIWKTPKKRNKNRKKKRKESRQTV